MMKTSKQQTGNEESFERVLLTEYLQGLKEKNSVGGSERSPYQQKLLHTNIIAEPYCVIREKEKKAAALNSTRSESALNKDRKTRESTRSASGIRSRSSSRSRSSKVNKDVRPQSRLDMRSDKDASDEESHTHSPDLDSRSHTRPRSAVDRSSRPPRPDSASGSHQQVESPDEFEKSEEASEYCEPPPRKSAIRRKKKKQIPTYLKKANIIVAVAFRNGNRDYFCRVSAPSIQILLERCTHSLRLPALARRIFLSNGFEVTKPKQIRRDADIYISMGEAYQDPFRKIKEVQEIKESASWTMNGLVLPPDRPKKTTKPVLSKRFRERNELHKRRVVVFRNGSGLAAIEVITDMEDMHEFMACCTGKFNTNTHIKKVYTWDGVEIENLYDLPEMEEFLQNGRGNPVLGPVWVTKGEGLSPSGVSQYLNGIIKDLHDKLRTLKGYQKQLQAKHDGEKDKIHLKSILSMSDKEVDDALNNIEEDIEVHRDYLKEYKKRRDSIADEADKEKNEGSNYTMKHINVYEKESLLSDKGVKLKVYENGSANNANDIIFNKREIMRGVKDKEVWRERFLDQCSQSLRIASQNNQARGILARIIYDENGKEIKDVSTFTDDQEIWISHGEPWIDPHSYCLTVEFDKVILEEIQGRHIPVRSDFTADEMARSDKASVWKCVERLPNNVETHHQQQHNFHHKSTNNNKKNNKKKRKRHSSEESDEEGWGDQEEEEEEEEEEEKKEEEEEREFEMPSNSISTEHTFLQNKKNSKLVLFPEPNVAKKIRLFISEEKSSSSQPEGEEESKKKNKTRNKFLWPNGCLYQIWQFDREGHLSPKCMPHISLCASTINFKGRLKEGKDGVNGYLVGFGAKGRLESQWEFRNDGLLYNKARSSFALTYLGGCMDDPSTLTENKADMPKGLKVTIALCEPLGDKLEKMQRWAIKQEKFDNIDERKKSKVENPAWNKYAYSWPLNKDGTRNEDFNWPMEGYFIPCAPPLRVKKREIKLSGAGSKKLYVLKNGERDAKKGMAICGPDLSTMMKDPSLKKKESQPVDNKTEEKEVDDESTQDEYMHCSDMTLAKIEFQQFLERCTTSLNMRSAARRLFDSEGKEHFTLTDLQRNELVYVSTGEPWVHPNFARQELRRRALLCKIVEDVEKIRHFIELRDPQGIVVAVDGGLTSGANIVTMPDLRRKKRGDSTLRRNQSQSDDQSDNTDEENEAMLHMTAHERSCKRSDQLHKDKLKWPYEKLVIVDDFNKDGLESNDEQQSPAKQPPKSPRFHPKNLQKFGYKDNFIFSLTQPDLVLTAKDGLSQVLDVVLEKKKNENNNQRWVIQSNGYIHQKYRKNEVLTVHMPQPNPTTPQQILSYSGAKLTLQQAKQSQFGRSNQQFSFNPTTGLIHAFYSSVVDKEVTAANAVNICTSSITDEEIDQIGYRTELDTPNGKKRFYVCLSCANSLRGRYKLQKLKPGSLDFKCCFGDAKSHGIREKGAFCCLGGKVNLSTSEAPHTLAHWEETIENIKKEFTVKTIESRLSEARTPRPVKLYAYRNGEARLSAPVQVMGSSLQSIFEQCSHRLSLNKPVRCLYTEDGTSIHEIDDLVSWYSTNRGLARRRHTEILAGNVAPELATMKEQVLIECGDERAAQLGEPSASAAMSDPLQVELNADRGFYEVGPQDKKSTVYELSITINMMAKLVKLIAPEMLSSPESRYVLVYRIFDADIATDPFNREEDFEAEKTTLRIRCRLDNLRDYFEKRMPFLCVKLIKLEVENNEAKFGPELGYVDVPLTFLAPENCVTLLRPISLEAMYSFHKPSFEKDIPGEKTKAILCAQLRLNVDEDYEDPVIDSSLKDEEEGDTTAAGEDAEQDDIDIDMMTAERELSEVSIEVWASVGEQFVPLKSVYKDYKEMLRSRVRRGELIHEMDTERHILRHMQARRIDMKNAGDLQETVDPENPVMIYNNWEKHIPSDEAYRQSNIDDLKRQLDAVRKSKSSPTTLSMIDMNRELYKQPVLKRIKVFPNGEETKLRQFVWGESLDQLLENAAQRLNFGKRPKYLFTMKGEQITDFDDIEKDQLLSLSAGESFQRPKTAQQNVEIKANWGRARKLHGSRATDIKVVHRPNPLIGVDPFGPPALAKKHDPYKTFESKRISVYENGKNKDSAQTIWGDSLDNLLTQATRKLNLRRNALCFYAPNGRKIEDFEEIVRDDLLIASTSGKGLLKI